MTSNVNSVTNASPSVQMGVNTRSFSSGSSSAASKGLMNASEVSRPASGPSATKVKSASSSVVSVSNVPCGHSVE